MEPRKLEDLTPIGRPEQPAYYLTTIGPFSLTVTRRGERWTWELTARGSAGNPSHAIRAAMKILEAR